MIALTAAGWPVTSNATSTPSPSVHSVAKRTGSTPGPTTSRPEAPEHLDPERVDLDDRHPRPPVAADQRDQAADRTSAEHQDGVAGLHARPRDVVRRDGQGLDDGGVVVGQGVGHLDEPVDRHRPVLLHPAREIDAQDLEVVADVVGADAARAARPAEPDGLHHDAVARRDAAAGRRLDDLGERLVADDPAVRDPVVEVALEDVEVGPADADAQHAEEGLAGAGGGDRRLARGEGPRALVEDRAHRARGCHEASWKTRRSRGRPGSGGGERFVRRAPCLVVVVGARAQPAPSSLRTRRAPAASARILPLHMYRGLQPKPQSGLT